MVISGLWNSLNVNVKGTFTVGYSIQAVNFFLLVASTEVSSTNKQATLLTPKCGASFHYMPSRESLKIK